MACRLEHANISVRDIEALIRFLKTAFSDFQVRGEGICNGVRWVHVGTNDTYIALNQANADSERHRKPYSGEEPGVNHLAYEVDNVESLRASLKAAGYRESTPPERASPQEARLLLRSRRE
jgi:catechol 2,3-dioxygenase-like lactoylglutathione lyase family enzyme